MRMGAARAWAPLAVAAARVRRRLRAPPLVDAAARACVAHGRRRSRAKFGRLGATAGWTSPAPPPPSSMLVRLLDAAWRLLYVPEDDEEVEMAAKERLSGGLAKSGLVLTSPLLTARGFAPRPAAEGHQDLVCSDSPKTLRL